MLNCGSPLEESLCEMSIDKIANVCYNGKFGVRGASTPRQKKGSISAPLPIRLNYFLSFSFYVFIIALFLQLVNYFFFLLVAYSYSATNNSTNFSMMFSFALIVSPSVQPLRTFSLSSTKIWRPPFLLVQLAFVVPYFTR